MLALALLLLAFVVALGAWARWAGPVPGDARLLAAPTSANVPRSLSELALFVVGLGSTLVALGVLAVLAAVWLETGGVRAAARAVAPAIVIAPLQILKAIFGAHPLQHLPAVAHYPSGHVAFVASVFGVAVAMAWRAVGRLTALLAAVPVILVGPAVLYAGGHVPSDVLGGYALAAAWVSLVHACAFRGESPIPLEQP